MLHLLGIWKYCPSGKTPSSRLQLTCKEIAVGTLGYEQRRVRGCGGRLVRLNDGFYSPSVIAKRCDVNNGDCMHFCELLGTFGAKCTCAAGYRLMEDGLNCEPEGNPFLLSNLILSKHPKNDLS